MCVWSLPTSKSYFSTHNVVSPSYLIPWKFLPPHKGDEDAMVCGGWLLVLLLKTTAHSLSEGPWCCHKSLPRLAASTTRRRVLRAAWYCAERTLLSRSQLCRWGPAKEVWEGARWQEAHTHTLWALIRHFWVPCSASQQLAHWSDMHTQ